VWGLMTLNHPAVRRAFAANREREWEG